MKVRASLKKRTPECKIVRRNGRFFNDALTFISYIFFYLYLKTILPLDKS